MIGSGEKVSSVARESAVAGDPVSRLRKFRLVPVIVIDEPTAAPGLAAALTDAGLPCAEVTFRTTAAPEAIRRMAEARPEMTIGAGTVLTPQQAASARAAGAHFIVAPGFNPRVVDYCLEQQIPIFPGACTPTEIEAILEKGLSVIKFFPAEAIGGLAFLKAIAAPYTTVEFIPTGGITLSNLERYLSTPRVMACGGSWMAPAEWIRNGELTRIGEETRRAVEAIRALEEPAQR